MIKMDSLTGLSIRRIEGLQHLGSKYGGWVVPVNLLNSESICYCVGCGEDISFDLELLGRFNCRVYGFDPTPRAVEYVRSAIANTPNYVFEPIGLWDSTCNLQFFSPSDPSHVSHSVVNLQRTEASLSLPVRRLSEITEMHGHSRIDLLKLDIEGAEYTVIETLISDSLDVRILAIEYDEYHSPLDRGYKGRIRSSLNQLIDYGFRLVHAQGNGNFTLVNQVAKP